MLSSQSVMGSAERATTASEAKGVTLTGQRRFEKIKGIL